MVRSIGWRLNGIKVSEETRRVKIKAGIRIIEKTSIWLAKHSWNTQ